MHAEASATQKIKESVVPLGTNNRVELAILRCASKTVGKIIDPSDLSHRGRTADCTNERLGPIQSSRRKGRSIKSSALVHCPLSWLLILHGFASLRNPYVMRGHARN
jgi:hypothetical protein